MKKKHACRARVTNIYCKFATHYSILSLLCIRNASAGCNSVRQKQKINKNLKIKIYDQTITLFMHAPADGSSKRGVG